jgi:Protein of unknown function (DUF998)
VIVEQVEQKAAVIKAARRSVLQPNARYRSAIGWLGFVLPIVVAAWPWPFASLQTTISAYYYTGARNWFVGTLWVLALFLFFYQYEPRGSDRPKPSWRIIASGTADSILGMVAGVSAFFVAMFPTTAPPCPADQPECPMQPAVIGMAHGLFASLLFFTLGLFPLLLFSQTTDPKRARMFRFCGVLMLVLLALTAVYVWIPKDLRQPLARYRPVFFVEAALVFVFGYTWLKKGQELAKEPTERDQGRP